MASIRPHDYSAPGGGDVVIYAKTTKLAEFFPGASARVDADVEAFSSSVSGHARKRFPGDVTPSSVNGHTRSGQKVPRTRYPVLPGQNFTCEKIVTAFGKTKLKPTQFTFEGDWSDLVLLARAAAPFDYVLRSPGGVPFDVKAV